MNSHHLNSQEQLFPSSKLIFGQESCFLESRQLVRRKVNIHYCKGICQKLKKFSFPKPSHHHPHYFLPVLSSERNQKTKEKWPLLKQWPRLMTRKMATRTKWVSILPCCLWRKSWWKNKLLLIWLLEHKLLKFVYSEKATKFWEISTLLLSTVQ